MTYQPNPTSPPQVTEDRSTTGQVRSKRRGYWALSPRTTFILFIEVLTVFVCFCADDPALAESGMKAAFDEATRLTKKNDYNAALTSLFLAYSLEPNSTITFSIANCYRHLGRYALAIEYYRRYRIEGGAEPQLTLSRIAERQILANNLPDPSSEWLNHWMAIKSLDSDLIALLNKADAYRNIHDAQHAIPIYAKLLGELPRSDSIHQEVESRIEKLSNSRKGADDRELPMISASTGTGNGSNFPVQRRNARPGWRVGLGISLLVAGTAIAIGGAVGASLPATTNRTGPHVAILMGTLTAVAGIPIMAVPDSKGTDD